MANKEDKYDGHTGNTDLVENKIDTKAFISTSQESQEENNETGLNTTSDICVVDPLVVEKLSQGVLEKLQPGLAKSRSMLEELTENQRILIETIQQENKKFTECRAFKDVSETMEKARVYHSKLLTIKRDMVALHEKSAKLKKRALRLQQQKNKEILEREQSREVELERERMLIARPAKSRQT